MSRPPPRDDDPDRHPAWSGFAWAIAGVAFTTLFASPWRPTLESANIVMLYLLVVVVVAYLFGRWPATVAAVCGVAAFDFFFVPPHFSFAVSDVQYLLTFAVMLATGLAIAHLTARLRQQAWQARQRERQSTELYQLARALSGAISDEQIAEAATRFFGCSFGARVLILLCDQQGELVVPEAAVLAGFGPVDTNVARAVLTRDLPPGERLPLVEAGDMLCLPLTAPMRTRGVLLVAPADSVPVAATAQRLQLETCVALIAIAVERVHFVTVARQATVHMEGERLRTTLLSALSHDLRTPLTAILGSAESMRLAGPALPAGHMALIDAVRDQARRTGELVENMLDMARLESGVQLRREWQPLEEIIGSALGARAAMLAAHTVTVVLPPDLPLIECDATLIERLFVNLLENAAKFTPAGSAIDITAAVEDGALCIKVADNGPGIEHGREARIFDKFERGQAGVQAAGLGLGLAICRAVVEVHGGSIRAENAQSGGAVFNIRLPLGNPPPVAESTRDAAP